MTHHEVRRTHCAICEVDPVPISEALRRMTDAIEHDAWLEMSSCVVYRLAAYIDVLEAHTLIRTARAEADKR